MVSGNVIFHCFFLMFVFCGIDGILMMIEGLDDLKTDPR